MLNIFLRQVRRVASALREKPDTKLDEYLLEHYIIYHGLSGTSPENVRQVKHVKQDIADACAHKSSLELCIALKLPPLYWQDKLAAIFSELKTQFGEQLEQCLLPAGNELDLPPENDPLRHPDWRVRSNAARMLAHLEIHAAIPRMVQALNDQSAEQKASFCHVALSLGQLRTTASRDALAAQLDNEEPWFVLDAASALSNWPLKEVATPLCGALLKPNPFADYLAVAVAQKYGAQALLHEQESSLQEAAAALAIGLIEAARSPHSADVPVAVSLHRCLPRLRELARAKAHPRRLQALMAVSDWMKSDWQQIVDADRSCSANDVLREAEVTREEFSNAVIAQKVLDWLQANAPSLEFDAESRSAASIAGELKITDAAPYLISLAAPRSVAIDQAIDALAQLQCVEASEHLLKLADQTVDIDDRISRKRSAKPVFEDNPTAAKTYWRLLGALSQMPTQTTFAYLMRARFDFAPDKRQQALQSLSSIAESGSLGENTKDKVAQCLEEALTDPATPVRVAALKGVGGLKLLNLLPQVISLVNVKDTSLRRQAQATVKQLHNGGFGTQVKTMIADCIAQERDKFKRDQLTSLLNSLGS